MTPPRPPRILLTLFDRYLAGDCTPDEVAIVEGWLEDHPERQLVANTLRAAPPVDFDIETNLDRVRERLASKPRLGGERNRRVKGSSQGWSVFKSQPLRRLAWSTITAFGLAFGILVLGWNVGMPHTDQRGAQSSLVYTTGNGERATVTLPDGGTVSLNVASRLEIPIGYLSGHHTVRLVGEGLFTVPNHQRVPLTVLAGGTAARVLGTSFVVRHYSSDTTTLVAVQEGKVAVGTAVVTAAHLVTVGSGGVPRVESSDLSPFTFASGVLTIDGLPLSAAVAELDRWYDTDIRLGDPALVTQPVKGEFAAGSLADLATMLEDAFNVRAVRNGRILTLYPRQ